jgi:hypothetical protein
MAPSSASPTWWKPSAPPAILKKTPGTWLNAQRTIDREEAPKMATEDHEVHEGANLPGTMRLLTIHLGGEGLKFAPCFQFGCVLAETPLLT